MASSHHQQFAKAPRERPQLTHVAFGLVAVLFFAFLLHQVLEESALVSIMVFNLLSILLTFPLKGPLWCKILWLGLGNLVGSTWNLIRLSLINTTADSVMSEFSQFILGPAIDFLWMVPIWSIGLSMLVLAERRKIEKKGWNNDVSP